MLNTVIFDLDGTLLDTLGDLTDAGNHVCRSHGWPTHTEKAFQRMVGHGIPNLVRSFTPEAHRTEEELAAAQKEFNAWYARHNMDRTAPYAGMTELVGELKSRGLRLAVYSNKEDAFTKALMERFFPGQFDTVWGKRKNIPVKPDPTGLRMLMAELGAVPEQTVLIGDSEVDLQTARNAGTCACGVTWGFRFREELEAERPEGIADTPQELLEWILRQTE